MKTLKSTIIAALLILPLSSFAQDIIVQAEDCTYVGGKDNTHPGYKGTGFVDIENIEGSSLDCEVSLAEANSSAEVVIRWANGRQDERDMSISVNGQMQVPRVPFGCSGDWDSWEEAKVRLRLQAGMNTIHFESLTPSGGPNIDQIVIKGAQEGTKEFILNVTVQGDGQVKKTPDQATYQMGTQVTLEASSEEGAEFGGWFGDISESDAKVVITIKDDTNVTASFN